MKKVFSPRGLFLLSISSGVFHSIYFFILAILVYPKILETYRFSGQEGLVRASAPAYAFTSGAVIFFSLGALLYSISLNNYEKIGVVRRIFVTFLCSILIILILFTVLLFSSIVPGLITGKRFF